MSPQAASVNWVLRAFQLRSCAVFELNFRFHSESCLIPGGVAVAKSSFSALYWSASTSSGCGVASRGGAGCGRGRSPPDGGALLARRGAGAGDQGRSKFGARADWIAKPEAVRRSASAPCARHMSRSTTMAAQPARRLARRHHKDRQPAIVLERVRRQRISDTRAVGELADAAGRVARDPLPQAVIVHVAAVRIGRKPFADTKRIAAGVMESEPAVGAADGKGAPVISDEHISHGDAAPPRRWRRRQARRRSSAAASSTIRSPGGLRSRREAARRRTR